MQAKKWLLISLTFSVSLLIIVFTLMIWSDTYSNIHYNRVHFYTEANKNVLKVHYILEHPKKYDSFIFGSSRVGSINPLNIKNGKYYNMTYSEGLPKEHLLNIRLFLKKGIHIKNLLIGLDEFSYQVSFQKHQHQGLTKAYYEATGTSYFVYLRNLYFRFPLPEDRHHISKKIAHSKRFFSMDIQHQKQNYLLVEKEFNADFYHSQEHKNDPKFKKPTFYDGNTLNEALKDISDIKKICTRNDINCTFYINPIYYKTYQYTNKILLQTFKKELATITSYYDFSIQNHLTHDNAYWLDTSHYTLEVGNMIIHKIYNHQQYPNHFGVYIPQKKEKD